VGKAAIVELSTYDQCHFFYLDNALRKCGFEVEEILIENLRAKLSPLIYDIVVVDGIPIVEFDDWVHYLSGPLKAYYNAGGKVVGIGEASAVITKIDLDFFKEVPPITPEEYQIMCGKYRPIDSGVGLEDVKVALYPLSGLPKDLHGNVVVALNLSSGETKNAMFELSMHDFLAVVTEYPSSASILAKYRTPYPARDKPAALIVNRTLLVGYHPEMNKTTTDDLCSWIQQLIGG